MPRTEPFDARDVFYAMGRGGQFIYVVPSADLVVVRMGPTRGYRPLSLDYKWSYLVNTVLRGRTEKVPSLPSMDSSQDPLQDPSSEEVDEGLLDLVKRLIPARSRAASRPHLVSIKIHPAFCPILL